MSIGSKKTITIPSMVLELLLYRLELYLSTSNVFEKYRYLWEIVNCFLAFSEIGKLLPEELVDRLRTYLWGVGEDIYLKELPSVRFRINGKVRRIRFSLFDLVPIKHVIHKGKLYVFVQGCTYPIRAEVYNDLLKRIVMLLDVIGSELEKFIVDLIQEVITKPEEKSGQA